MLFKKLLTIKELEHFYINFLLQDVLKNFSVIFIDGDFSYREESQASDRYYDDCYHAQGIFE